MMRALPLTIVLLLYRHSYEGSGLALDEHTTRPGILSSTTLTVSWETVVFSGGSILCCMSVG